MQAESSLWGRKRVVGSKLKHDGTLGFISRGAARRSGLNPAGWHRYVPIVVVAAIVAIALAALGYAGGGAAVRWNGGTNYLTYTTLSRRGLAWGSTSSA